MVALRMLLVALMSLICAGIPAASAQTAEETAQDEPAEGEWRLDWPREYTDDSGAKLILNQPQIMAWDNYEVLHALLATVYTPPGAEREALGTIELSAITETDLDAREVVIADMKLVEVRFTTLNREQTTQLVEQVKGLLPERGISISLDRAIASVERGSAFEPQAELKVDPPPILVSYDPAVLVMFDGEPVRAQIRKSPLTFVINTNWDVFHLADTNTFYLRWEESWLKADDVKGSWTAVDKLPAAIGKLPADDENWQDVLEAVPGKRLAKGSEPEVFVSFEPAELITIAGDVELEQIPGTKLQFVTNTDSDLLFHTGDRHYYLLTSGRWFKAQSLEGPWTFATNALPEDFANIPQDHALAEVLSSVPGTPEADEAVILASIPHKAEVKRGELELKVTYYGEPKFEPIEGTELFHAVNTDYIVIRVSENEYYVCHDGVWFFGPTPQGSWELADEIPSAIYDIPASSPVHNVTYVQVYDATPEAVVYGYTMAYLGVMIAYDTVFYGPGWYYPPYWYVGPGWSYPIYRPWPPSYGFRAYYNPATGTFGRAGYVYGPHRGFGGFAAYNPRTGAYVRGRAAYGPGGTRGWMAAYNPSTGTGAVRRGGSNVYGNWKQSAVRRGNDWIRGGRVSGPEGGKFGRYKTSKGNQGFFAKSRSGDLYAGRNGNVYKRGPDGSWQKFEKGKWTPHKPGADRSRRDPNKRRANLPDRKKRDPNARPKRQRPDAKRTPKRKQQARTPKRRQQARTPKRKQQVRNPNRKRTKPANRKRTKPTRRRSQNVNRSYNKRQRGNRNVRRSNNHRRSANRNRGGRQRGGRRR